LATSKETSRAFRRSSRAQTVCRARRTTNKAPIAERLCCGPAFGELGPQLYDRKYLMRIHTHGLRPAAVLLRSRTILATPTLWLVLLRVSPEALRWVLPAHCRRGRRVTSRGLATTFCALTALARLFYERDLVSSVLPSSSRTDGMRQRPVRFGGHRRFSFKDATRNGSGMEILYSTQRIPNYPRRTRQ